MGCVMGIAGCVGMMGCAGGERGGDGEMGRFVEELMGRMTMEEKLGQLNLPSGADMVTGGVMSGELGDRLRRGEFGGVFNVKGAEKIREMQRIAVEETRLGIPLLIGADVIHGYETVFPIPLALSCSWNPEAVERMARISAEEASVNGINWTFSPMVDICRDARWGRIAEGNGEDPYLGSVMAGAYVRGYQGEDMRGRSEIMACVKHFALYGAAEGGRDYNTVDMSRQRMMNEYLEPYKGAVDAGVGSVMSSFNVVDGVPATAHGWLLTDLLRDRWGFDGMVVTDYNSIGEMRAHGVAELAEGSAMALQAGTDMDMVSEGFFSTLAEGVKSGRVSEKEVDRACRRVLEAKWRLGLFENPYKNCDPERAERESYTAENRKAAREIAAETFVLLKNEGDVLPLSGGKTIALVGPMADAGNNMCGMWSITSNTERHEPLVAGMRRAVGEGGKVLYAKGSNVYYDEGMERGANGPRPIARGDNEGLLREALAVARQADVVVAALGESAEMSGESASRSEIGIPDAQKALLKELVKVGKPVVLVLFTGRPLVLDWEEEHVDAILNVWYAGSEAADAIADVVMGKVAPSGRLTTTFPRTVGQIPVYYNHMNTGRPDGEAGVFNRYNSNYIDVSNEPLYPFGYGLSYTTFEYGDFGMSGEKMGMDGSVKAWVTVTNSGKRGGWETVQLYVHDVLARMARPVKELKGFKKVWLEPGESKRVEFEIGVDMLRYYNNELEWVAEPGEFEVMIGGDSRCVAMGSFVLE